MNFNNTRVMLRNQNESKKVQEKMIRMGWRWGGDNPQEIKHLGMKFLIFSAQKTIECVSGNRTYRGSREIHKPIEKSRLNYLKELRNKKQEKFFNLIVDTGKPSETTLNKEDLLKELKRLKELSEKEDFAYCDIFIYDDETKEDITEQIFKEFDEYKQKGGKKE